MVRRPAAQALPHSAALQLPTAIFPVGSAVEYHSKTHGAWIPAKVLAHNRITGLYDLDCKANVEAEKLRRPRSTVASSQQVSADAASNRCEVPRLPVGSLVEYKSSTLGKWISAKVLSFNPVSRLYDLDCKAQVEAEKLRPLQTPANWCRHCSSAHAASAAFCRFCPEVKALQVGARVEAFYEGAWFAGSVRSLPQDDAEGRWKVQCDQDAEGMVTFVQLIRPRLQEDAGPAVSAASQKAESLEVLKFTPSVGTRVEAFYEDQWYPGTVVSSPEQDDEGLGRWAVQCDADPAGLVARVVRVRPLTGSSPTTASGGSPFSAASSSADAHADVSPSRGTDVVLKRATAKDGEERLLVTDHDGKELARFGRADIEYELTAQPDELGRWLQSLERRVIPGLLSLLGTEVNSRGAQLQAAEKSRDELMGSEDYEFFGLDGDTSDQDLNRAYRRLSTRLHPDKGGDEAQFADMRQRYERLQQLRGASSSKKKGGGGSITWEPDDVESMFKAHEEFRLQLVYVTRELTKVNAEVQALRQRCEVVHCLTDMQPATGGA
eukprot:TRINITY_DN27430_c0_g1_i1.p1 TRINITY_DN27430_c0_g1~~TRINITY_DN27430_c0_g1_i1.p1  ORF type:complete len:591 (+),score=115.98 TRINITY_DN27430_c0_g1_i1:126-1775(+)